MIEKNKILSDHIKKGKVLKPPLLTFINRDSNYIENAIPEIIWITLLIDKLGIKLGTDIGLKFVNTVRSTLNLDKTPFYISWYSTLPEDSAHEIINELKKQKIFEIINVSLSPLLDIYSLCPLNKIFKSKNHTNYELDSIKDVLLQLYNKKSKYSTFTLGSIIYYLSANGNFHIVKNSAMTQLPKLVDYPNTELSRLIASGIRATSNVVIHEPFIKIDQNWNSYFWNRGITLEPCKI